MAGKWQWWHQQTGVDEYRIRELLRAVWDLHAMYGHGNWVWRGQANSAHNVTPGIHSRLSQNLSDESVVSCAMQLLSAARFVRLDRHEGACLPDLALLAMLQHHGAATPLLDVSLDPIVALYMAVVSTDQADDESDGTLFAIKKPIDSIRDFTSSSFAAVYEDLDADKPSFYSAPDVSERLRIQRGHFLVAKVKQSPGFTVPLGYQKASKQADAWIYKLLEARGQQGAPPLPTTEVVIFRINKRFKRKLKIWLEDRSGLTVDFVYPTPWHRPHLDAFCAAHGRSAKWTNIELPKDPAF